MNFDSQNEFQNTIAWMQRHSISKSRLEIQLFNGTTLNFFFSMTNMTICPTLNNVRAKFRPTCENWCKPLRSKHILWLFVLQLYWNTAEFNFRCCATDMSLIETLDSISW